MELFEWSLYWKISTEFRKISTENAKNAFPVLRFGTVHLHNGTSDLKKDFTIVIVSKKSI